MDARRLFAVAWLGLLLAGCSSNVGPWGRGQNDLPSVLPASPRIKNVIVIIQENRSLNNFFAGYPGANAPASGCAIPNGTSGARAIPQVARRDSSSGCLPG